MLKWLAAACLFALTLAASRAEAERVCYPYVSAGSLRWYCVTVPDFPERADP